jgi:hypothetical protein
LKKQFLVVALVVVAQDLVQFLSETDEIVQLLFADCEVYFALERGKNLAGKIKEIRKIGEIKRKREFTLERGKKGEITWERGKLEGRNLAFSLGFSFRFWRNSWKVINR